MDYDAIEAFLVGRCGKTEREAMLTSFREFRLLSEGHEQALRERWEIARWEQWMQVNLSPYIKPLHKPRRPRDLMRFPWENDDSTETVPEPLTHGQAERLNGIMKNFYMEHKHGQDR